MTKYPPLDKDAAAMTALAMASALAKQARALGVSLEQVIAAVHAVALEGIGEAALAQLLMSSAASTRLPSHRLDLFFRAAMALRAPPASEVH